MSLDTSQYLQVMSLLDFVYFWRTWLASVICLRILNNFDSMKFFMVKENIAHSDLNLQKYFFPSAWMLRTFFRVLVFTSRVVTQVHPKYFGSFSYFVTRYKVSAKFCTFGFYNLKLSCSKKKSSLRTLVLRPPCAQNTCDLFE